MAKPILIIKVPLTVSDKDSEKHKTLIEERLKGEYHVLVSRCLPSGAEMKFECIGFQQK
jgi:hypothetical protein